MPAAPRTPTGLPLEDGYQTVIELENAATIALFEKTVQPAGLEGGDKVDTTTMHNVDVRTYAARFLKEVTDAQMTVAYDPAALVTLLAQINVPQTITIHFPNGDTWDFRGYLKNFIPAAISEGSQPEATCVLVATNTTAVGAETTPNFTAAV